jgi:small-conductance mechanosensitive channel
MKRDDLADLTEEQKDLVMSLYGKAITKKDKEIETLNSKKNELEEKISTYETKINEFNANAKDNADWKHKFDDLQNQIKNQEAKRKAEDEDKILTNNIIQSFGDKKFTSEYAKNGLINDVKSALAKPENKGKGITDLVAELSKDKEGIFASPNEKIYVAGVNENITTTITKDAFEKMSYNERVQLKQDNPELFKKLNN